LRHATGASAKPQIGNLSAIQVSSHEAIDNPPRAHHRNDDATKIA
jgi:hypothetical protein